ncbi:mRNA 3'-end-processing protein rna14 [Knufia fluminis]|uniref:mRNA 3'-end-processing protein RNA14 n=1 Tax=Knufia fluminis TaxID=191047 RepID=A0AAN8IN81_9EURO|nr:mRNA 3'-end-processing protein rna14 [Knufia fluminis]
MSNPILSPSQSHPLPPRPLNGNTLTSIAALDSMSSTSTPVQTASKTRGGFELDDEDDHDVTFEDVQDDDVYDTIPAEVNGSAPNGNQDALDRPSKSPTQENGMTPVPAQATDSPANVPSSVVSNIAQTHSAVTNGQAPADQSSPADILSVLPKSRLAHDVVGMLEDRIKDDPRGDSAAWLELIEEYKSRNKDDQVRRTYERYLDVFPLAAEQWCAFLRWEEAADRKWHMEQIFKKALISVPSVELFAIYVNYVRRRHSMQTGDTSQAYKNIHQTFEFALKSVGMDKDSGSLWQDYINFLRTGPGTVGGSGWQDSQKMDALREAYGKALSVPTSAIQSLWKEYDAFETGINKINGRKMMQERSPDYMTARTAYTQLQNITRKIIRTSQPRLPPALGYAGDLEYQQQVSLWREWLQWEKDDPLELKEDKLDSYLDRVIFIYKQALMALQFWPEMWYEAAEFCLLNDREDTGLGLLNQGFAANPESVLLAFKLADRLESTTTNDSTNDPGAKLRMKTVREPYDKVLDALYDIQKKTEARMQGEIQSLEASTQNGQATGDEEINASNVAEKKAALDAQITAIKDSNQVHLDALSNLISHVWVALMRATRRVQGKGLPNEKGPSGFRTIFNEARKRGQLTPEFYVETAHIEWNCYRDATGTRILERGVKLYPNDSLLPLEYIKHLISKDDLTNARAVFETTVGRFTSSNNALLLAKSKDLFMFFHDYESKYGELPQVVRLESRIRELFPEDPELKQFSARYRTPGFDPMSAHPIVSATQRLPKTTSHASIEVNNVVNSPIQKVIDHITNTNSPKRPLPLDDDDDDGRPQKIARGNSPFMGTQVRKIPQPSVPARPPAPAPLPPAILHLLSILPKSSAYTDIRFDAVAIQKLIREKHLPPPTSVSAARPPPTPQVAAPTWPPQYSQGPPPPMVPPPQGYVPQGTPTSQYAAGMFASLRF